MHASKHWWLLGTLILCIQPGGFFGCTYNYDQFSSLEGNTGGNQAGGNFSQGGTALTEADAATGGNDALGGTTSTDIIVASGGDQAQGGTTSTAIVVATGGIQAQGGTTSTNIVVATGGTQAQGGTSNILTTSSGGLSSVDAGQGGSTHATSTGGNSTGGSSSPAPGCSKASDCGSTSSDVDCVNHLCVCSNTTCYAGQTCRKRGNQQECHS